MDQNMTMAVNDQGRQEIDLPPGFRFHPTDEELITYYLCKKVADGSFVAVAIGEADLNKCEPWDLPGKAKMGENEWYFFCLRDKKYPTGLRTNRATEAGYWKATGKDKEIFREKALVGMKKTLVFYRGRAPKGEKSNWVMHEYRLEGKMSLHNLPKTAKTEWVISRVFEKSCNGIGKKIHIAGAPSMMTCYDDYMTPAQLPPLMDFSHSGNNFKTSCANVSCFSNQTEFPRAQDDFINPYSNNNQFVSVSPNQPSSFPKLGHSSPLFFPGNYQFSNSIPIQDQASMRAYLDNTSWSAAPFKSGTQAVSVSQETGLTTDMNCNMNNNNEISSVMSSLDMGSTSGVGPVDLDCLWPY